MLLTLMAPSCGDSHFLRRVVDDFIVRDGKRNQLTSGRSTCVLIRTDLPVPVVGSLLSYDQPIESWNEALAGWISDLCAKGIGTDAQRNSNLVS